ncbi:MAG: hypothetical protein KDJ35_05810 [Alphaproteobacteria bacterium]|nr:hypothetical protein [Alphaproteobacteria bacterium]
MAKTSKEKRTKRRKGLQDEFLKNGSPKNSATPHSLDKEAHAILSDMISQKGVFRGMPFKHIKKYFEKNEIESRSQTAHRIKDNNSLSAIELQTLKPLIEKIEWALSYQKLLEHYGQVKDETKIQNTMTALHAELFFYESHLNSPKEKFEHDKAKERFNNAVKNLESNQLKYLGPIIAELQSEYGANKKDKKAASQTIRLDKIA